MTGRIEKTVFISWKKKNSEICFAKSPSSLFLNVLCAKS